MDNSFFVGFILKIRTPGVNFINIPLAVMPILIAQKKIDNLIVFFCGFDLKQNAQKYVKFILISHKKAFLCTTETLLMNNK